MERNEEPTRIILLDGLLSTSSLEGTVDYLAEELDLERSGHVREVGQSSNFATDQNSSLKSRSTSASPRTIT